MKARFLFFLQGLLLIVGMALLYTCAFQGQVYVAFNWNTPDDRPNPVTSDFHLIPNAPDDLNDLTKDYFISLPGTHTIHYESMGGGSVVNKDITLEAVTTVGGFEDTFYTIQLSDNNGVTVSTIP